MRATKASVSFISISVAIILGVTSIVPSHGSVPGPLGNGDCVQQVTGVTGSVTREGNDCLVAFKSGSGTWIVPNGVISVDYLLVGGGGGGGATGQSGGGGGGAMVEATALSVTPGEAIALAVGAGGAAGSAAPTTGAPGGAGSNGLESIFGNFTAFGGGGGSSSGQAVGDPVNRAVSPGGSGGGDVASPVGVAKTTASTTVVTEFGASIAAGTAGLGSRNSGGRAKGVFQNFTGQNLAVSFWVGAGGGGAGQPGEDAFFVSDGTFPNTGLRPGNGGNGLPSSILSSSAATTLGVGHLSNGQVFFAGGGGGRANFDSIGWNGYLQFSPYGLGGSGGLGAVGSSPNFAGVNTGGGGRGERPGASGVAVIRYVIPQATSLATTSSSSTEISLTWLAPSISETVIGYRVEKSPSGANTWSSADTTPNASSSPSTSTTVTGLSANTTYDFRVTPTFASGDGITSLVASGSTPKTSQVITWGPSNTSALVQSSPLTPSSLATTSGDGAITYGVQNPGSTSCSVDSSSGVLTFSAVGTCVVRATAAETASYATAYRDVTFTISMPGREGAAAPRIYRPSGSSSSVSNGNQAAQEESFVVEARQTFTLTGSSLETTAVARIGGVKAEIVRNTELSLTVRIPRSLPAGKYDLELSGPGGTVIEQDFFIVAKKRSSRIIQGFPGNSTEMNALMKASTRSLLRTLFGQVSVICVGSTSNSIATSFDRELARKRAIEACDFVHSLNPALETSIRIKPASGLGPKARNVRLVLRNY